MGLGEGAAVPGGERASERGVAMGVARPKRAGHTAPADACPTAHQL